MTPEINLTKFLLNYIKICYNKNSFYGVYDLLPVSVFCLFERPEHGLNYLQIK